MNKEKQAQQIAIGKWVVAAVILFLIFQNLDIDEFQIALQAVDKINFLGLILAYILINYFCESYSTHFLTRNFSDQTTLSSQLKIRGKAYILGAAHQSLGLGGHIFFIKQKYGLSLSAASALFLVIFFTDGLILSVVGLLFLPLIDLSIPKGAIFTTYLVLFVTYTLIFLFAKLGKTTKIAWLSTLQQEIRNLQPSHTLLFLFWRIMYFISVFMVLKIGLGIFASPIPTFSALALFPICILVGFLPITPFGIGTFPVAMSYFFSNFSNAESIIAFTLCYLVCITFGRLPIGLLFWLRTEYRCSND